VFLTLSQEEAHTVQPCNSICFSTHQRQRGHLHTHFTLGSRVICTHTWVIYMGFRRQRLGGFRGHMRKACLGEMVDIAFAWEVLWTHQTVAQSPKTPRTRQGRLPTQVPLYGACNTIFVPCMSRGLLRLYPIHRGRVTQDLQEVGSHETLLPSEHALGFGDGWMCGKNTFRALGPWGFP